MLLKLTRCVSGVRRVSRCDARHSRIASRSITAKRRLINAHSRSPCLHPCTREGSSGQARWPPDHGRVPRGSHLVHSAADRNASKRRDGMVPRHQAGWSWIRPFTPEPWRRSTAGGQRLNADSIQHGPATGSSAEQRRPCLTWPSSIPAPGSATIDCAGPTSPPIAYRGSSPAPLRLFMTMVDVSFSTPANPMSTSS